MRQEIDAGAGCRRNERSRRSRKFGPRESRWIKGLAQSRFSARCGSRHGSLGLGVSYFDWHDEPGYFRDVTRHFPPDSRILDVGCGTAWLARHFPNYTGIDSSPDAIRRARERGFNVELHSLTDPLRFSDEVFDGVVLKDVLEHLTDPVPTVREVHRVLQVGGTVFASTPDAQRWAWDDYTHRRPYTRTALRLLFADQGFQIIHAGYESVMPGTSVVARWTRSCRRPRLLQAAAWLPFVKRNVWLLARR